MFMNFVVALILCSIGFAKYGYFISLGYGLSMCAMSFSTLLLFASGRGYALPAYVVLQLVVLFLYGLRACGYRVYKELGTPAPAKEDRLPVVVSIFAWLGYAACMMVMFSPVVFRITNGAGTYGPSALAWIGFIITLVGLAAQVAGDYFAGVQEKTNSACFCTKGIFKYVRFPKQAGDLVFWTGIFVGSWSGLKGFGQWFLVLVTYLVVIYLILNSTKREEKKLYAQYVETESELMNDFMAYVAKTPIVIPFVKIYTFKDSKIIL